MVASNKTIEEVCEVIYAHVSLNHIDGLFRDLKRIKGSKSFIETIKALEKVHKENVRRMLPKQES